MDQIWQAVNVCQQHFLQVDRSAINYDNETVPGNAKMDASRMFYLKLAREQTRRAVPLSRLSVHQCNFPCTCPCPKPPYGTNSMFDSSGPKISRTPSEAHNKEDPKGTDVLRHFSATAGDEDLQLQYQRSIGGIGPMQELQDRGYICYQSHWLIVIAVFTYARWQCFWPLHDYRCH
ncbi:hypothetical protein FPV67DRAFT_1473239 [Lyophyllum atratum]|nr:hypothetical protein FPV67DRAFT_1473239 [Lyophyllum atratum]